MKPQDIVVLLKKTTTDGYFLSDRKLAESLGMSASSISDSLNRCKAAQLVDRKKKKVNVMALKEFMEHGIQYTFPVEVGRVGRGIPTYISASPIKEGITNNGENYVWHYTKGTERGQQIKPLYSTVPDAALKDAELYNLLVIADTLRMGRTREREIAMEKLTEHFNCYVEKQQR